MKPMLVCAFLSTAISLAGAEWRPLLNHRNLEGWEVIGDGVWIVMADATLLGERRPSKEFDEFDLHLAFGTRVMGNSCVSIRDPSRAKCGITSRSFNFATFGFAT